MDSVLARVLRVHPEPFEYVDERSVHAALTADPERYLAHLEDRLASIAAGKVEIELPPKLLFTDRENDGDFRVMPCVFHGDALVKTVKIVGTNVRQEVVPDQVTVGKAFRLDPVENHITHVFEACLLSSARTGACAVIGMRRLLERPRRVAVVGAGRVGYYAALFASTSPGVERITIHDRSRERASALASALAGRTGVEVRSASADGGRRAPLDADALILATTSREPFLAPEDTTAAVVVSVGADTEDQRELTDGWAERETIHVDSRDAAHVGDVRAWLAAGLTSPERLTDLLELFRSGPRGDEPRLLVSTGSALLDNLTIGFLLHGDEPQRELVPRRAGEGAGGAVPPSRDAGSARPLRSSAKP